MQSRGEFRDSRGMMRLMWWRIVACAVIGVVALCTFSARSSAEEISGQEEVPPYVADWFMSSTAQDIADAFPNVERDANAHFSIGVPWRVYLIVGKSELGVPESGIAEVTGADSPGVYPIKRWFATISDARGQALGALFADYRNNTVEPSSHQIIAGQHFAQMEQRAGDAGVLVYDQKLAVWYIVANGEISPANRDAQEYLLGAMREDDYLAQRERILGNDAPAASVQEASTTADEKSVSLVWTLIGPIVAFLLLLVSVSWLEYERRYVSTRSTATVTPVASPAPGEKRVVAVDEPGTAHTRIKDMSRKVVVYRRHNENEEI